MGIKLWKGVALILITALAISASACSSSKEDTTAKNEGNKQGAAAESTNVPVKLKILWWGAQNRHDATLKALELYTKKNPNVTFEPEYSSFDGYFDKLAVRAAAKNAPDIIQQDTAFIAEYISRKQLADLSGLNVSDMDKALLESGTFGGKLYGVPLGNNGFGYVYNKAALEKMGVALPKDGWAWDDLLKLAREIKPKIGNDKYVFMDYSWNILDYGSFQMGKGKGDAITAEGKYNIDKATFLEWVDMFDKGRKEGLVPSAEMTVTAVEFDAKMDQLVNGTVLFKHAFAPNINNYENLKKDTFALITAPRGSQSGGFLKPSMYWTVSADSKQVTQAKKFIEWFINDPEVAELLGTSRGTPVSNKIVSLLDPKFTPTDKAGNELIAKVAKDAQPFKPDAPGWSAFKNKDFKSIMEGVMFNKMTGVQAYEELTKKAKEYEK